MRHRGLGIYKCVPTDRVTDAVLTPERLSLDWDEEGWDAHLEATSPDGVFYTGTYGYTQPDPQCRVEFTAYRSPTTVLLFGQWWDSDGSTGHWMIELQTPPGEPPATSVSAARRSQSRRSKS